MIRCGIGYDVHRLAKGRKLILGGVEIAHARGLEGHSDADVLSHAIADALLGATGAGDIGQHFPDTDPKWKGADSMALLRSAHQLVRERGYALAQADLTIITEQPQLSPHLAAMAARLAERLGAPPGSVSVKAKTNEGMGFIGRGEGIAVIAVATLEAR